MRYSFNPFHITMICMIWSSCRNRYELKILNFILFFLFIAQQMKRLDLEAVSHFSFRFRRWSGNYNKTIQMSNEHVTMLNEIYLIIKCSMFPHIECTLRMIHAIRWNMYNKNQLVWLVHCILVTVPTKLFSNWIGIKHVFVRKQNGISSSKIQAAPEYISKHGVMDGTVNKPQCSLKLKSAEIHLMFQNLKCGLSIFLLFFSH